ncbi:hypothetical protein EVAR_12079_1 [Eumeta japonica]|uniref:Uncharacterized protein n=1 Tax=Eumeta variegata TaxID=151549 RepID=A0A4C1U5D5_EUMVA|nr:hypothetical protein EVAR_12079_1 [Eumeta japonica]
MKSEDGENTLGFRSGNLFYDRKGNSLCRGGVWFVTHAFLIGYVVKMELCRPANKMSEVPVKKKHQSGSEKRKKRQEQQNKLNEQLKKTQNLFKLGFSCESKEHQLHDSLSTSSPSHTMAADPVEVPCEPFEQIGQDQETPTLVGAEESEAETEVIHQNVVHLGLTVVLRYVTSNGEVAERFLKFLLIQNHKGEELATEILNFLSQYNIDVRNLRARFVIGSERVSDTRWCARADATKALANGYNSFQKALQSIAGDETQTSQAIHEAKCLLNDLGKMKML